MRGRTRGLHLSLFFFLTLTSTAATACDRSFTLGMSDWGRDVKEKAVFESFDFDERLVAGIMALAGRRYHIEYMPPRRLQQAIRQGLVDGAPGASITVDRAAYAAFSKPYRREVMALFMPRDKIRTTRLESIADLERALLRIGVASGSWYGAEFDQLVRGSESFRSRMLVSTGVEAMFQWLGMNRVDAIVADLHFGLHMTRYFGVGDAVGVHPLIINDNGVHLMFSKESVTRQEIAEIDAAIGRFLRSDGYSAVIEHFEQGYSRLVSRTGRPDS